MSLQAALVGVQNAVGARNVDVLKAAIVKVEKLKPLNHSDIEAAQRLLHDLEVSRLARNPTRPVISRAASSRRYCFHLTGSGGGSGEPQLEEH